MCAPLQQQLPEVMPLRGVQFIAASDGIDILAECDGIAWDLRPRACARSEHSEQSLEGWGEDESSVGSEPPSPPSDYMDGFPHNSPAHMGICALSMVRVTAWGADSPTPSVDWAALEEEGAVIRSIDQCRNIST